MGVIPAISANKYAPDEMDKFFDMASSLDVKAVEVFYERVKDAGVDKLRRLAGDTDVILAASFIMTKDALAENIAKLNNAVSFAKEVHSQIVNLYCGVEEGVGGKESRRAFCRMIEEVLPSAGVVLTLENELNPRPGTFAQFEWWKWLAQELPEPFGLTFDLANFIASGCNPTPEDIKPVAHRIRHLHVKDIVPLTEELRKQYPARASFTGASGEYLCVPVGQGIVEHQPFLKALSSYSGYCTLEALREEEQYRASLDFLQTLL